MTTFPRDLLAFYRELETHNRRDWFEANRNRYETSVLEPARAFVRQLGERLRKRERTLIYAAEPKGGAGSIFRIQRDTRFSKDKAPFKTNLGMLFWLEAGRPKKRSPHFYVGVDTKGVLLHTGLNKLDGTLLGRFREAVASERSGRALQDLLDGLVAARFETGAGTPQYKRVPPPYPPDHPRGELLRHDGVFASKRLGRGMATSEELVAQCEAAFEQTVPLLRWLRKHVGTGEG